MNTLLRIEYVALFALSLFLFTQLPYVWWWYLVLFLVPDIGMIGYVAGARIGAITYNLTHHLGIAVLLFISGSVIEVSVVSLCGVIMLGHSAVDRLLGYGLKYSDSFHHTHLGRLKQPGFTKEK